MRKIWIWEDFYYYMRHWLILYEESVRHSKYESKVKQTPIHIWVKVNMKQIFITHEVLIVTIIPFYYSCSHKFIKIRSSTAYVAIIFLVGPMISCSCTESAMKNGLYSLYWFNLSANSTWILWACYFISPWMTFLSSPDML